MNIQQNISLKSYNTFGIESEARYFVSVDTIEELQEALALPKYLKKFLLGGGSNMLLTGPIDALVIHVNLKGIAIENQNQDFINEVVKRIPLSRMAFKHEYQGLLVFLLSQASSYINGATIAADGGRSAW